VSDLRLVSGFRRFWIPGQQQLVPSLGRDRAVVGWTARAESDQAASKAGSDEAVDEEVGGGVDNQQPAGDIGGRLDHVFLEFDVWRKLEQ